MLLSIGLLCRDIGGLVVTINSEINCFVLRDVRLKFIRTAYTLWSD